VAAGYVGVPHALGGDNRIEAYLAPAFGAGSSEADGVEAGTPETPGEAADEHGATLELGLMGVSVLAALGGIGLAAFFFLTRREAAARAAARFAGLHRILLNKYYVDELYDTAVVTPLVAVSRHALWRGVDAGFIDGSVNGVGTIVRQGAAALRQVQTGSVRAYAAGLLLGAVMILGYYLWR
jgi:NADH-quinone oxidoreductase subunit L